MKNMNGTDLRLTPEDLKRLLQAHAYWLETDGQDGQRAVLSNVDLSGCDLTGCQLMKADLAGANLQKARLCSADLTGANLLGADLRDTDFSDCCLQRAVMEETDISGALFVRAQLTGARLQGVSGLASATLRDACLEGAIGLTADDLAGTNLTGVRLPSALAGFDRMGHLSGVIGIARPLYLFVLVVTAFIVMTVFSTPDVALFTNAPSAVMPNLSTSIPAASLFWIAPLILIFLYAYLHFYMARVWQDLGGLPNVLPDGTPIERGAHPWLFINLVCLRGGMQVVGFREALAIFLMWGAVPATLLAIWWRYLPLRDWPVTGAHIVIVLFAVWGALRLFAGAMTHMRRQIWRVSRQRKILWWLGIAMVAISIFCHGLPWLLDRLAPDPPEDGVAFPEAMGVKPKNVLWLTADLEDGDLDGAAMTRRDLRYAYGHRASLVAVNLKDSTLAGSDFQRADFSRALLEDVDLSDANLDSTGFHNACLRRARLVRSDLEDADLSGAYLGRADLSYAYLGRARMQYANLQGANLAGADLTRADLRGAIFNCYASHQHDTKRAPEVRCTTFRDTNFSGADLRGAQFLGSDLSTARHLTPQQLAAACGVNVRLPPGLGDSLPDCGEDSNLGIAPGALAKGSPVNPQENPCWHEMLSDFGPGPPTGP